MHAAIALVSLGALAALPRSRREFIVALSFAFLACGLAASYEISDHFTGEGITWAVLAHLGYGIRFGELGVVRFPWLGATVIASLIGFAAFCVLCWYRMRTRAQPRRHLTRWLLAPLGMALLSASPAAQDLWLLYRTSGAAGFALNADLEWEVGPIRDKARPLVYIYVESLERTFLNQKIFPNVAPHLANLEREFLSFRGIKTAPFMNWTVAGMAASQCGMPMAPLARSIHGYQPGASCIGDLLADHGYALAYIGGADLDFAGKGRFYQAHGFSRVLGFNELKADSSDHSIWGVYDDVVFERAKSEFIHLASSGLPFGLFVLTTTTHPPGGYPSPACRTLPGFENTMLEAVRCSDRQVFEFVHWLRENGPQDLILIIGSDHLHVAGDVQEVLRTGPRRENTLIVLGYGSGVVDRVSTMVDVAPTVAYLLGFDARSIGLGRNLLLNAPTLAEKYGYERFVAMLPGWRVGLKASQALPEVAGANVY